MSCAFWIIGNQILNLKTLYRAFMPSTEVGYMDKNSPAARLGRYHLVLVHPAPAVLVNK
jgi:hypothetical protein